MAETTVTEKPKQQLTIKEQLNNPAVIEQIRKALPSHMSAERMARIALTAMTKVPKLAQCTPASFFKCLLDLSSWGLEPDGRHAHLIPYGQECTLILDYKGIVALSYRSGFVRNIHSDVVRTGDIFTYSLGKVLQHTPWAFRLDAERPDSAGEVIAAYCIVELKDDACHHEGMTRSELDAIKNRSRAGNSGPWITDRTEMDRKSVFRRASKWLPISTEQVEAFDRDADRPEPIMRDDKRVHVASIESIMGGDDNG